MDIMFFLVLLTCAVYLVYFLKRQTIAIESIYSLMFLSFLYYGLSVPVDILLGADISYKNARMEFNDISLDFMRPFVVKALIYYLLFAVSFHIAYVITPGSTTNIVYKTYQIPELRLWLLLCVNVAICIVLLPYTLTMSEAERALHAMESSGYKILSTLLTFSQVLYIISLTQYKEKKQAIWSLLLTLLPAIVKGSRFHIVLPIVLFALRYRIEFSRFKFLCLGIFGILFIAYWKLIFYGVLVAAFLEQGDIMTLLSLLPEINVSLSGLESLDSYIIFVNLLGKENFDFLFGSSYIVTPLLITLPRFWTGFSVKTLSEEFTANYDPELAAEGGGMAFSGLAESWMNFGALGPALLGLIWGWLAKYLDTSSRGIIFFIFFCMTAMIFRTEFAALYKQWIVIFGGYATATIIFLKLYSPFKKHLSRLKLKGSEQ